MSSNKKVMIIEDEVDLCLLLKDYFTRKSYDVLVSNTLNEGASFLKQYEADIVFLDNNLPDGSGWTLAPAIAAEYPHVHIILLSAFNPQVPQMPVHSKFSVIEKPIAFSDLDREFAGL